VTEAMFLTFRGLGGVFVLYCEYLITCIHYLNYNLSYNQTECNSTCVLVG